MKVVNFGRPPLFQPVGEPGIISARFRRGECAWAAVLLILTAAFYFWTATSAGSPLTSRLAPDDLYNRLSDGFLGGRLSFLEAPNPALAQLADPWDPAQNGPYAKFHDVTYFHGKYYLYFGPTPVLLLAPWKALTGTYLPQNVAAVIFSLVGVAATMGLILVLRGRHFPQAPSWVVGLCLMAAASANFGAPLLRRPVYYEVAIACAYACAMTALLSLAIAMEHGDTRRRRWLVLAGLGYGLAVAARPNYIFGAVVLAVPVLPTWRAWRRNRTLEVRAVIREALPAAGPFLGIVALLLLYNWLRFGRPAEFGTSYMLSGLHPQRDVVTSFRFLPTNLWFYLFAPAQLTVFFPFFDVIPMPWFPLPAGYTGEENAYGVLACMPLFWMLYFFRKAWRDPGVRRVQELRDFGGGVLALVACNALVICRVGGAANRYLVDLIPPLIPLAILGIFWVEQAAGGGLRRAGIRMLWLGALGYTAALNGFVSLQHNDLFKHYNPSAYRRLAHAFDHLSVWLGKTGPGETGPLRIRLVLPTEATGKLEPLVVTGLSYKADFLWIYFVDDHDIKIGFEHTSYGGPVTDPIDIDFSQEHTLEVEMGSLYPPVEHPFFDGMPPAEVARLKRTLRVSLDGRLILGGTYDFYDSSPGDVTVGRNPVSDAFGRHFAGRIVSVQRLGSSLSH